MDLKKIHMGDIYNKRISCQERRNNKLKLTIPPH